MMWFGLVFFLLMGYGVAINMIKTYVLWSYALMSAITLIFYAWDKFAAQTNRWRIPEKTLHILALLGGWPGAMMASQWFRHKIRKKPFIWVLFLIAVLHILIMIWLFQSEPGALIRSWFKQ